MLDPAGVMISNLNTSRKNDGKDSISLWALTHDRPLWKKARSMSTMRNPHTVTSLTAEEWYSSSASALGIWNFTYFGAFIVVAAAVEVLGRGRWRRV
jgi:hypothetical protein